MSTAPHPDAVEAPLPGAVAPMKATVGELPPDGEGWVFEVKWDGMRAVTFCDRGDVRAHTVNLKELTPRFPELAPLAADVHQHRAVVDGELVVFDRSGRPSFGELQHRIQAARPSRVDELVKSRPALYVVFDLVHLDGYDLTPVPFAHRRVILGDLLGEGGSTWRTSTVHTTGGAELLAACRERGLEGLVAKRVESRYEPGRRTRDWRKVKIRLRQEFVVGGWSEGSGGRSGQIGSLVIGYHEYGHLRWAGRVGSGLTEAELARLGPILRASETGRCPFDPEPDRALVGAVHWVQPTMVVEVEFGEWTADGRLRHPVFLGVRADKEPDEVVREPVPGPDGHPGDA